MEQLPLALQGQAPTFAAPRECECGSGRRTDGGQQPPSGRLPVERDAIACGRSEPAPEAGLSRRGDPETSKLAAKRAAGTLEREKRIILRIMEWSREPLTTAEMAELWHGPQGSVERDEQGNAVRYFPTTRYGLSVDAPADLRRIPFHRHTPARRMKILEHEGKVVRGKSRRCRATGNYAQEWSLKR